MQTHGAVEIENDLKLLHTPALDDTFVSFVASSCELAKPTVFGFLQFSR
jgi:hypothetical protein